MLRHRLSFPFNLYAAAFASAIIASALSLPFWKKFCSKAGLMDDPGHRKIHEKPVPLAGGLAVLTGLLAPTLLACLIVWLDSGGSAFDERFLQPRPHFEPLLQVPLLKPHAAFLLRHGLD